MDFTLRYAKTEDIPTLKKLWQICFGDRMRYIDVFFEEMFKAEDTVVCTEKENICGVAYILERKLNGKKFMYGYAIGVFPEYRGKGLCEKMLSFIKQKAAEENCIFGLHPANDKLTEFYKKIGLKEMYTLKEVDASDFESDVIFKLENIDENEFYNLRKNTFSDCVEWGKSALAYLLKNGETVKKITLQHKKLYFVISKTDATILIKETNANDEEIKLVTKSIKEHFKVTKIKYLLPNKSTLHGVVKPMILGFGDKNDSVYMNLFLD